MRLNPECIRDLMLTYQDHTSVVIVEVCGFLQGAFSPEFTAMLSDTSLYDKYTLEEVLYHTIQLSEAGYIWTDYCMSSPPQGDETFQLSKVYSLTPKGHELAARIADEKRWTDKIKPALHAFGSISLSVIEAISSGVAGAYFDTLRL